MMMLYQKLIKGLTTPHEFLVILIDLVLRILLLLLLLLLLGPGCSNLGERLKSKFSLILNCLQFYDSIL